MRRPQLFSCTRVTTDVVSGWVSPADGVSRGEKNGSRASKKCEAIAMLLDARVVENEIPCLNT